MSQKPPPKQFVKNPINGTKFTLLVSSAKGGVGKSTVAVNLAFALQKLGMKIGILDADVYGPSLPKLINHNEKPKSDDGKAIIPVEKYNAQCMSMGFLVDEQTPMIWRGLGYKRHKDDDSKSLMEKFRYYYNRYASWDWRYSINIRSRS